MSGLDLAEDPSGMTDPQPHRAAAALHPFAPGVWRRWLTGPTLPGAAILLVAGLLAYHNSFRGVFLYDDLNQIVQNDKVRTLQGIWRGRPVVNLTLALNYALGGHDVWGYHAFNLAVHLLAGLALYGLVRRTLLLPRFGGRFANAAPRIALGVSLLWLVHPLLTESVTYVIQRAESMMGLFYLLALYCMVRGAGSQRPVRWYAASIASAALGMGCKPVIVTVPVVAILLDRAYLTESFAEALRRRWGLYAGLCATWLVLLATGTAANLLDAGPDLRRTAGFGYVGCTPLEYALTQPGVILHYLRLVLWPHPLCLDYDWPITGTLAAAAAPGAAVGLLAIMALLCFRARPAAGFLATSFFVLLAPTSSVVPFAHAAFEHRMYLPLAALAALVVPAAHGWLTRVCGRLSLDPRVGGAVRTALLVLVAGALGLATIDRNRVYHDEFEMWADVMTVRPGNPLPYNQIGNILTEMGDYERAMDLYGQALRLRPGTFFIEDNLANVLLRVGRVDESIERGRRAVATRPDYHRAQMTLGMALTERGDVQEGLAHLREAVRLSPRDAWAHANLGRAAALAAGILPPSDRAAGQNRAAPPASAEESRALVEEAVAEFAAALRLWPDMPEATTGLAAVLTAVGDISRWRSRYGGDFLRRAFSLAWLRDGDRRRAEGDEEGARQSYSRAFALDVSNDHARMRLAETPEPRPPAGAISVSPADGGPAE
jgi:tetratricopeptide (TPR) repeat protein